MRKWTEAQASAINERGRTLLVSAAAGSGKTAVLTERIIRTLTDKEHPADITRLLVVTFTRAAAGELRQRIAKALSEALALDPENEHLARQLVMMGGAEICTIDSFYLSLVRAHFEEAGFPASFRTADEGELLGLRRQLMQECIDRMFETEPQFGEISDLLCNLRQEASLTDKLLDVYNRTLRYARGIDILQDSAANIAAAKDSPLQSPWGKLWAREVNTLAQHAFLVANDLLADMQNEPDGHLLEKKYANTYCELSERCKGIVDALDAQDYERARKYLALSFDCSPRGKTPPITADFMDRLNLAEDVRKRFKKNAEELGYFSLEEIRISAERSAALLILLHRTLTLFEEEYRAAKMQREVAEFSDVSRAAYRLLVAQDGSPTALAREISAKYDAIYIDEYQDVDRMQDATFRAIATKTNRFMVGDIKQSIYGFRGASPEVFDEYRRAFPHLSDAKDSDEALIFMSNCFRCDEAVVRFTNTVSRVMFNYWKDGSYERDDELVFSKTPPSADYVAPPCRIVVLDRDKENPGKQNPELRWIACEIKRLLEEEKKADGTPICPGDIAVMMRTTKRFSELERELSRLGIPVKDTSHQSFFENPDVVCVYSLLAALDNPQRDVYLAAALRSPFFGFTLDELVEIRGAADPSLSLYEALCVAGEQVKTPTTLAHVERFLARFSTFREKARALPVDRLLRYLYRESAILSFAGHEGDTDGAPATRRANLRRLYEYARTFEAGGFKGLYQFVRYVDDVMENKGTVPAPEGEPNAVSLITIHHSKGLEYPVCFVADTAANISLRDTQDVLLMTEELGCTPRISNLGPLSRANTFFRQANATLIRQKALQEEIRVLYVALSRARERLYVTALAPRNSSAQAIFDKANAASLNGGLYMIESGPGYIYWVLSALLRDRDLVPCDIEILHEQDLPRAGEAEKEEQEAPVVDAPEVRAQLPERFAYRYPHEHLTRLPAKLSVSRLSPGVLDVYDADALSPDALREEDVERLLHSFERTPAFGEAESEPSAAERGTATHEFLQFCDFAAAERDLDAELTRLIEMRFLPPRTEMLVRREELSRFFESSFYASLRGATSLRRETRFHIHLPAARFTSDEAFAAALGDEQLTVQGVVDLFYTDAEGRLILCDYKTDRLSPAELKSPALAAKKLSERHGEQLSYYACALGEICGKRPDKILIYSLPLGEAIEVKL